MFSSKPSFDGTKLKLTLKLAITRLSQLDKKYENLSARARKTIADYLKKGKTDMARIQVEQLVRDDFYREALEQLQMYCQLLVTRFGLIEQQKDCDPGILGAVSTVVWASPRVQAEVPEFKEIKKHFGARYGSAFVDACLNNAEGNVNSQVKKRLEIITAEDTVIEGYLSAIAEKYDIPYTSNLVDSSVGDLTQTLLPTSGDSMFPSVPQGGASGKPPMPPSSGGGGGGGFYQAPVVQDKSQLAYPPPVQQQQQMPPSAYPPPQSQQMYPPSNPSQQYSSASSIGFDPLAPPPPPSNVDTMPHSSLPEPTIENGSSGPSAPTAPSTSANDSFGGDDDLPDFDELNRRFEALRRS